VPTLSITTLNLKNDLTNLLVGIDYSITSPAIAILQNGTYNFAVFPRTHSVTSSLRDELHQSQISVINVAETETLPKKAALTLTERRALQDAQQQIQTLMGYLAPLLTGSMDRVQIAIEGLSFASTSSRLSQISGYQWLLRRELLALGLPLDHLWIFTPNQVKATAGKGNFSKEEMISAFISEQETKLLPHPLHIKLNHTPELFQTKRGNWLKPLDDICDAYWIVKTLEKNLK
jgi:hypothetical protein